MEQCSEIRVEERPVGVELLDDLEEVLITGKMSMRSGVMKWICPMRVGRRTGEEASQARR